MRLDQEEDRTEVLKRIIQRGLNVAKTEEYIDAILRKKAEPNIKPAQPMFVLKDVRLFLNTVNKGMSLMKQSGIDAEYGRKETETDIILTIKIPKDTKETKEAG